ncbi:MAG: hypothetical protein IJ486_00125 [Firmicutes bacterium]|nr:hypothetical protein [Bacillota bacterium]
MNKNEISKVIVALDWRTPVSEASMIIDSLSKLNDKDVIGKIFNEGGKNTWEGFVKLAAAAEPSNRRAYFPYLLELLQDMNWPGSLAAMELLEKSDLEEVIAYLKEAICQAFEKRDFIWMSGLDWLVHNIEQRNGVKLFLDEEDIYNKLSFAEVFYY